MSSVQSALVAVAVALSSSAASDGFDGSLAAAEVDISEGRLDEAAARLEALASAYPQDFRVRLRLAAVEYQRGGFEAAHAAYEAALRLSGPGSDAQIGLGWTHLALGEPDSARADFSAALAARPGLEAARAGLRACLRAWPMLEVWAVLTGQGWPGHPAKDLAGATSVGLHWRPTPWLAIGAQYRGATFWVRETQPLETPLADFSQHEAWLTLGYETPRLSVLGRYGFVHPRGQGPFEAHVAALSIGLRSLGAAWLDGALTRYEDLVVGQVGLSWRLPLGAGFWATPEGRLQVSDELGGAGGLELGWSRGPFAIWLAGLQGRQIRPVSVRPLALYNLPEQVRLDARGGAQIELSTSWRVFAEYELVELSGSELDYRAWLHLATLGIGLRR